MKQDNHRPFRIVPLSRIPSPKLSRRSQLLELLNHPYFKGWLERNSPEILQNLVSSLTKHQVGNQEGGDSLLAPNVKEV